MALSEKAKKGLFILLGTAIVGGGIVFGMIQYNKSKKKSNSGGSGDSGAGSNTGGGNGTSGGGTSGNNSNSSVSPKNQGSGQPIVVVNPDGSQTVTYPDGTVKHYTKAQVIENVKNVVSGRG